MHGKYRDRLVLRNGLAFSKDEAAQRVESEWFEAIDRIDRQMDG